MTLQNYEELRLSPNIWDKLHDSVTNRLVVTLVCHLGFCFGLLSRRVCNSLSPSLRACVSVRPSVLDRICTCGRRVSCRRTECQGIPQHPSCAPPSLNVCLSLSSVMGIISLFLLDGLSRLPNWGRVSPRPYQRIRISPSRDQTLGLKESSHPRAL